MYYSKQYNERRKQQLEAIEILILFTKVTILYLKIVNQLDIFKGKSFLEFNDIIGLPVKNNKEYPIFDYELDVINKIENQ